MIGWEGWKNTHTHSLYLAYTTSLSDHIWLLPRPVCKAFTPQQTGSKRHHSRLSGTHMANLTLLAHTTHTHPHPKTHNAYFSHSLFIRKKRLFQPQNLKLSALQSGYAVFLRKWGNTSIAEMLQHIHLIQTDSHY